MKSSTRNIIVVAVVAVVLGGAVFALNKAGGAGGGSSGSSSADTSSAAIKLISKSGSEVASMKVTNKKGSYTLVPLPTGTLGASSSGSSAVSSGSSSSSSPTVSYTVQELGGCPVDTGETNSVVQDGFSLSATKNIGKADNLAEYGLQNPQATIEVTFRDGSNFGYKIGSATATDSSAYYMCGLESNNVYVVNVDAGILEDANYFVTKDMLSISAGSDTSGTSGNSSSNNDFSAISLSGKNFPKGATLQKNSDGQLAIVSPAAFDVDTNSLSSIESALSSLSADSVAAVHPDAAALKKYGFDAPTVAVDFTANKKPYKLVIGAQNSKGYYAMVNDVNVVYHVTADSVNGLVTQNLFSLRSKLIFLPNIATIKRITVASGGKTDEINVSRTENPASSTKDKKAYNYKVAGNAGKALNYDTDYRNAYQTLIGLTVYAAAETDAAPSGTPDISIQYDYFDKADVVTLDLYKLDSRRYTAVLNGKVYGLCDRNDVDPVLQTVSNFEAGKAIATP